MVGKYILARCSCGFATGGIIGKRVSCRRCGSNKNLVTESTYETGRELASSIKIANMPQHLRSEFYDRIKKSKSYSSHKENVDPSKSFTKAITELANINSEISMSDLEIYFDKNGHTKEDLLHCVGVAEIEGILSRAGPGSWIVLDF